MWNLLAVICKYKAHSPDKKFCYDGPDERRIFIEYNGYQFILVEMTCGQQIYQMCVPNDEIKWEDNKKTIVEHHVFYDID